jgi:hypothetical protein
LVSRFISLFIPLEMLLKGSAGTDAPSTTLSRSDLDKVKSIILRSGCAEAERLAAGLGSLRASGPSLPDRFEAMARVLFPDSMATDVEAFRKFNRIRNELVHQGRSSVDTQVKIRDGDVIHLQDLTEKYVGACLFLSEGWRAAIVETDLSGR